MICAYYFGKVEDSKTALKQFFFNYFKIIQTDWRKKLGEITLESLFRIKVEGPALSKFAEIFCSRAVTLGWNDKERHIDKEKESIKMCN